MTRRAQRAVPGRQAPVDSEIRYACADRQEATRFLDIGLQDAHGAQSHSAGRDFELDGVTFPVAEVQVKFMDPAAEEEGAGGAMFSTGNVVDDLEAPGVGTLKATMINAGIPTIFVNADSIGYAGTELQDAINGDPNALAMFETICVYGALGMGLIKDVDGAAKRQHTPKVAFVAKPVDYTVSSDESGRCRRRPAGARALHGQAAPRPMGTAAVAIGTAAAIPGTLVNLAAGGGEAEAFWPPPC